MHMVHMRAGAVVRDMEGEWWEEGWMSSLQV